MRILNSKLKRAIDITVSLTFLLTIFPFVFALFGILVKMTSRGPVIFRQERNGLDGRIFNCLKFRTMVVNDDADFRSCSENDSRVTPIGRFMRVTFIDELPQFINILRGEMSLIGPRPHMLYHTRQFSKIVPHYAERLRVRPGLTGVAQVLGYNGEIKKPEDIIHRVYLDRWYIRNWSPGLDAKVFFRTLTSFLRFRH